ncbi:XRE family transcriptional regulator, partial [Acinetobacter lwoffii]
PQTLQKMEQPEGNPTLKSMQKLLDAFGLKLEIRVKS